MAGIYFTSDTHFHHLNIVKGVSTWKDRGACRNYKTLEEHDELLVQNINKTVSWDSVLYHCGDFSFGGIEFIWKFRDRLNVQTLHLIGGNHDHHARRNAVVKTDAGYKNIQSLFTSYDELVSKKIAGQNIVLCHYALRTWEGANKGAWNLHGHSHGGLTSYQIGDKLMKQMDVGIDTHPEFRPYHFDEIEKIMKNRYSLNEGHHE